jgi:S-adenosylmethionine-diacylglycerol 3-amino-3-carboxypropyl transferase
VLGRCIGLGHLLLRLHGRDPARLLAARDPLEQRAIFASELAPVLGSPLVRLLAALPVTWFGLGIPPAQLDSLKGAAAGGIRAVLHERLERLACGFPVADNYFAWQAFARRYDPAARALPPYLEPAAFERLRARADRVRVHRDMLTGLLAREDASSLDGFVLLDAQDWMTARQLRELWTQIDRTAAPGARVIFRTAAAASPLEAALPADLLAGWTYERERSAALFARDRSAIYGGFHLYRRRS